MSLNSLSFPKQERLLKAEQFLVVRNSRISVSGKYFRLGAAPYDFTRLGLVASKKIGTAVVRNRLKRKVREHFRLHRELYPKADVVLIFLSEAPSLSPKDFYRELEFLLIKLHRKLERSLEKK